MESENQNQKLSNYANAHLEKDYLLSAIASIDWHYFDVEYPEERYKVEELFREFLWHSKVEYNSGKGYIDFQWVDWRTCLWNHETLLMRARGGSKTRDLALLFIFYALSGLNCCWRTAESNQLIRLYEVCRSDDYIYKKKSPDLRWCVTDVPSAKAKGTQFIELIQGLPINVAALTENSAVSGRFNIIGMDEMARLKQRRHWTDFINTTSDDINYFARIYGFSTPLIATPFEKEWEKGKTTDIKCLLRDWSQIPWLTKGYHQAVADGMSEFDLNLNFRCVFDFEKISLFPNVLKEDWKELPFDPSQVGVDFGIPDHHCVGIYMKPDRTECWILTEDDIDDAKDPNAWEFLQGYNFECERGGWNEKFSKKLKQHFPLCGRAFWTVEDKIARLRIARKMRIHINPRLTPNIANDLRRAHMDGKNKTYVKNKDYPMHYFDGFLHAIGAAWTSTYTKSDRHYKTMNEVLKKELAREKEYVKSLLANNQDFF